jgi:hypothetical protein
VLNVYAPPPGDSALPVDLGGGKSCTAPGIWIGAIAAIGASTVDTDVHLKDILGVDTGHLVAYFDHDIAPSDCGATAVSAMHVANARGFHLVKVDQGTPQAQAQWQDCEWGGLCVKLRGAPDANLQDASDYEYGKCLQRFPSAVTCTEFWQGFTTSAADVAESNHCVDLQRQMRPATCSVDRPTKMVDNPQGLADPLEVVLGTSIWDL